MADQFTGVLARPPILIDFTDGDTYKRVTVADSFVTDYSKIETSIRRTDVADVDDPGWIYIENVASVDAGTFDVIVAALPIDAHPIANNDFPNETISLHYTITNT